MNLNQTRLDSLIAQLNMAMARNQVSTIQVAMLRAQIRDLRAKIEAGK